VRRYSQTAALVAALSTFLLTLAVPGQAAAVTTIGSNLAHSPDNVTCGVGFSTSTCTVAHESLPTPDIAIGGITAPSAGVVVKWRIKLGGTGGLTSSSAKPRVLRGNTPVATGESQVLTLVAGTYETATRLSIHTGDRFGLDITSTGASSDNGLNFVYSSGGGDFDYWNPPAADNVSTSPSYNNVGPRELLMNADIEPDADADEYGDETQDLCPTDPATQGSCPITPPTIPATPAPAPDTTRPIITLAGSTSQKLASSIVVAASCDEACSLTASGKVMTTLSLKPTSLSLAPNVKGGLKLRLSSRQRKKISRALRAKRKASAVVTVTAKDAAGNAVTVKREIKLKR